MYVYMCLRAAILQPKLLRFGLYFTYLRGIPNPTKFN